MIPFARPAPVGAKLLIGLRIVVPGADASQPGQDVLARHGVVQAVVLANVPLDLGDQVVLVLGGDDRLAVRDFVFFETNGAKTWKMLAKYHQVDAVNAAVEEAAATKLVTTACCRRSLA